MRGLPKDRLCGEDGEDTIRTVFRHSHCASFAQGMREALAKEVTMRLSVGVHALSLEAGAIAVIDAPRDLRIAVRRGTAWITQDGDPADTVLTPRAREWRVPGSGQLIVQAMDGPLTLDVRRMPQAQPAHTWRDRLHRVLGARGADARLPEAW